jgi:hypothetical protein
MARPIRLGGIYLLPQYQPRPLRLLDGPWMALDEWTAQMHHACDHTRPIHNVSVKQLPDGLITPVSSNTIRRHLQL